MLPARYASRAAACVRPRPTVLASSFGNTRSFTSGRRNAAPNRIFDPVRNPDEFSTLLLLSGRRPLITLWTASWCPSCEEVAPVVKGMIESDHVGEAEGGVGYAEVQLDSPTIGDLGLKYMITSMPTLLAFSRQEPQMRTRVSRVVDMKDRRFLTGWIESEARRGGEGGAGGSLFGWFGR